MADPTTPADCSAERLMGLVRAGSVEALDQITRCYGQKLLEAGRRHCRTSEEAQDAVQDALLTAAQQLGSLREDSSLEGWLIKIVASACRHISRGHKNDASSHDADALLVASGDPEQAAARLELGETLERLLLGLSARDRSIVVLAELEDFSAAEIGKQLEMSAGAVRTRLSRLRAGLLEQLQRELSGGGGPTSKK